MAFDSVPWFVGGGAEHSPEVARTLAYAATGGNEGIIAPADVKVTAQPTPGASVQVAPGAVVILSRSAGGAQQSYVGRMIAAETVAIAATGSGAGRTDMIVAQIEDPFAAGGSSWPSPVDPKTGPYIFVRVLTGVPAGARTPQEIPAYANRSAVALARVTLPASTATVTAAMITDLRKQSAPKSKRVLLNAPSTGSPSSTAFLNPMNSTAYVRWPWAATFQVDVPSWATHAVIRSDVTSYVLKVGSTTGRMRTSFCGQYTPVTSFDENWSGDWHRNGLAFAGSIPIGASYRGTTQTLEFEGQRSGSAGAIDADVYTNSLLDITFEERPL